MIRSERNAFIQFVLIMLIALFASGVALAQEVTPEPQSDTAKTSLSYSAPANGEITNSQFSQLWTLQTASADRINIRVERTGGNLIPGIEILDASTQAIQTSYGADRTSAAAEIIGYTLPIGGDYVIKVSRKDGETGLTEGTYTLTVTPQATADDNPNNKFVIGAVQADTVTSGEVTGAHWYQRYTFTANGTDAIRVNAQRTSGTLFPEVEVLDANGTVLQTGYTFNTGDEAQIDRLELPSSGEYTVVVTRASRFRGNTLGTYDLLVTLIGAGENSPLLAATAGNQVVYDTPLQGTITARWYEDWTLTTQAGDTISLSVTSDAATSDVEGNLQPEVILLGGSGQELRHGYTDDTGATATIDRLQLDGPGTYTVRVSRAQGKTGFTSGPYTLTVTLNGTGAGSPVLSESAGAAELETAVEGEITDAGWMDIWMIQGEAGQAIDINVERTGGTLVPLVEIQDANGQSLRTGYYEPTQDHVKIDSYTLPGAGQYRIRVYRENEQNGYTSGVYSLLVTAHVDE